MEEKRENQGKCPAPPKESFTRTKPIWTLDAHRAYYWVHCTEAYVHFQFDMSRAGQVSRDILGPYFDGTLVTDCYSGYYAHQAGAKQKCLAHLARTARDWQKIVPAGSLSDRFFTAVRDWVRRGCRLYRNRADGKLSANAFSEEEAWLRAELDRLASCPVGADKGQTLHERIRRHPGEWLVFLDDPRVPPTNNSADRMLRPLTVSETARRHGRRPTEIFYRLYTRPPNQVLRYLYAGRLRASGP